VFEMAVLIVFYTQTGNTRKIAEALKEGIKDLFTIIDLVELKKFNAADFNKYELVFVGGPCHDADVAKPIKKLLEKIPNNPQFKLAGFITHACFPPEVGGKYVELFERWVGKSSKTFEKIAKEKQIDYLGFFRCMGAASKPIEKFIHRVIIKDKDEFQEFVVDLRTHPDETDIIKAKAFAYNIAMEIL
jgi:flavodoxin